MADVLPEPVSSRDSINIIKKEQADTTISTPKMTVEKIDKTECTAPSESSKLTPTKTENAVAPSGSPDQLKTAVESVSLPSPKKNDPKSSSPPTKASSGHRTHTSFNAPKNSPRKNPWNRNPPTGANREAKQSNNSKPAKTVPQKKEVPSKGIHIPKVS